MSDAIAFDNAYVNNVTKVNDPSFSNDNLMSAFNVWGYMVENTGTVFTGDEVKNTPSGWTYLNTQYWAPEKAYWFEAVAPANGSWTATEATEADITALTFTNNNGTEDLLYAYKEVEGYTKAALTSGVAPVQLQFGHLLSKVQFSFKSAFATDNVTVKVSNVKMNVPAEATVALDTKEWTGHNGALELTFGDAESTLVSGAEATYVTAENALLTIPTAASQTYEVNFDVEVFYGAQSAFTQTVTSTISGYELAVGKAYNFQALIGPEVFDMQPIEFTVVGVDGWVTENVDLGYYVSGGSYVVTSENGLKAIAAEVNAGVETKRKVVLNNDIDLSQSRSLVSNWTPIGTSANPFKGTFDGQGYTIKNLVIDGGSNSNIGLFGVTHDGEIKNVTVENAKVSGRLNVGVVAGTPYTSKYTNITVKGHVEVDGMAYVGGVGGKNAYANWNNITVNVDETSYVHANSVENGTAYRSYVGGVCGFNGEGGHTFSNIYSNIDVKGSTIDAGGLFGIAHYGNSFVNCVCEGDVLLYAAPEASDAEECGGIAGVWHNQTGYQVTLTNCSYTGTVKATNEAGEVYFEGNKLVGAAYSATGTGKLVVDGLTAISTADAAKAVATLNSLMGAGESVLLGGDLYVASENVSTAPYGNKVGLIHKGGVFNGGNHAVAVQPTQHNPNQKQNTYGIMTYGGTIKNVHIDSFRGVVTMYPSQTVVLENVHSYGEETCYFFNTTEGDSTQDVVATNCTFGGWGSWSNVKSVTFNECTFILGSYYTNVFGRLVKPYVNTVFSNCEFNADYYLDLSGLGADQTVTFVNCKVNGVALTSVDQLQKTADGDEGLAAGKLLYCEHNSATGVANVVIE